jgi:hypothetical protein
MHRIPTRRRAAAVVALLIVVVSSAGAACGGRAHSDTRPSAVALVTQLHAIPQTVFDTVGPGSALAPPRRIAGRRLQVGGKPTVLYIGAEYCPFCATERWPLVIALLRFGTFTRLGRTRSASDDVYPDTRTFTFHGATYRSRWINFVGVETHTNKVRGSDYATLDKLTVAQRKIFATYANPPYVSAESSNGIPLIDFDGRYLVNGATYRPEVLQGKTAPQIVRAVRDPTSKIAQGAIGVANVFTATICTLTNNQPASACTDTAQQLEGALG